MTSPFLTFLTDFGDTAPATCRGVIWSIAPEARINDLTHGSRQFGIREGALLLWSSLPYQPVGVHLAVVDPRIVGAEDTIDAMDLRGFGAQRRTWLRQLAYDALDRAVLAGFAVLLVVVTYLSFTGRTELWVPEVLIRLAEG